MIFISVPFLILIIGILSTKGEVLRISTENKYATVGSSHRFVCEMEGSGTIRTIKFVKDMMSVCSIRLVDGQVNNSPGYSCNYQQSSRYYIEIESVKIDDEANWMCRGANSNITSNSILIPVYDKPRDVLLNVSTAITVIEYGDLDIVKCTSDCYPTCTEIWYKGNTLIPTENGIMKLSNLSRTQSGDYFCVAYHQQLNISKSSEYLHVIVYYGPDAVQIQPSTVDIVREGGDIEPIQCSATCYPECSIRWFINNINDQNLLSTEDGVLILKDIKRNQSGSYICQVVHQVSLHQAVSKALHIAVHYGPDSVDVQPSSAQSVFEGSDIRPFVCTVDCFPVCTVNWYINSIATKNKISSTDGVLELRNIQRNQSGDYFCQAVRQNSRTDVTSGSVHIDVLYGPDVVIMSPSDIAPVLEGDNSSVITCTSHCNPPCIYSFYKDTITKNNLMYSQDGCFQLINVQRNQSGNYICLAIHPNNSDSFISSSFYIDVYYGPNDEISEWESIVMMEGEDLPAITCKTDCNPPCSLNILLNGTLLNSTENSTLKSIERSDSGNYSCQAFNNATAKTSEVKLVEISVHYGPDTVTLLPSSMQTVVEGFDMVNIACEAECYPYCTYTWYKKSTMDYNMMPSSDGVIQLKAVKRSQAGTYICKVSNPTKNAVSQSAAFMLDVVYSPTVNQSINYIRTDGNNDTYGVILKCDVDSKPQATVMWYTPNGMQDTLGSVMELYNMSCGEVWNYSCIAQNGVGDPVFETFSVYKQCMQSSMFNLTTKMPDILTSFTPFTTTNVTTETIRGNDTTGYQIALYTVVGFVLVVLIAFCVLKWRNSDCRRNNSAGNNNHDEKGKSSDTDGDNRASLRNDEDGKEQTMVKNLVTQNQATEQNFLDQSFYNRTPNTEDTEEISLRENLEDKMSKSTHGISINPEPTIFNHANIFNNHFWKSPEYSSIDSLKAGVSNETASSTYKQTEQILENSEA